MKMEVVGLWQPSPTATDVTAELAAIERAGADIVFTALSGPVGIVVGRQMGERNLKAIAFGINVEGQKDGFWQATAGKGNFVATLDTYSEVELTPKTVPFVKAFKARFHKAPTYTAATYDAINLLKESIEKAGSADADKLVPVLEQTSSTGTAAHLRRDGHGARRPRVGGRGDRAVAVLLPPVHRAGAAARVGRAHRDHRARSHLPGADAPCVRRPLPGHPQRPGGGRRLPGRERPVPAAAHPAHRGSVARHRLVRPAPDAARAGPPRHRQRPRGRE